MFKNNYIRYLFRIKIAKAKIDGELRSVENFKVGGLRTSLESMHFSHLILGFVFLYIIIQAGHIPVSNM